MVILSPKCQRLDILMSAAQKWETCQPGKILKFQPGGFFTSTWPCLLSDLSQEKNIPSKLKMASVLAIFLSAKEYE